MRGCFASLSMTKGRCYSEHSLCVIPSGSEESSAWMLRFAEHDKSDGVVANAVRNPWREGFALLRFIERGKRWHNSILV